MKKYNEVEGIFGLYKVEVENDEPRNIQFISRKELVDMLWECMKKLL